MAQTPSKSKSSSKRLLASLREGPYGLLMLGGALMGLCWLPFQLGPLMPLGAGIAIAGLERARTRKEAWIGGILFGAARYLVASHFLLALAFHHWSAFFFYPMAVLYILPQSWFECAGAWWLEQRFRVPRGIGLGITYSLTERLRTIGDTSFPADLLSHAYGDAPAWLAWNHVIGPFSFTFIVFVVAYLGVRGVKAWHHQRSRALRWLAASLLLWLAIPLSSLVQANPSDQSTIRAGIVQPFVQGNDKLDRSRWPALQARLERMSQELADQQVDLIVWPETTRPGPLVWGPEDPEQDPLVQSYADKLNTPILYGTEIAELDQDGRVTRLYNGAAIVHPHRPDNFQWYGKQRLLPFVEGVPFADLIGWDPAQAAREGKRRALSFLGNFYRGPKLEPFKLKEHRLGVLICYEGFYPNLSRDWLSSDATALVLLTNDAWWGKSTFAPWHSKMLSARARETGLPILRGANSGISNYFDSRGYMGNSTEWLTQSTVIFEWPITRVNQQTFWSRAPDVIYGFILILGGLTASIYYRRQKIT